MNVTVSDYVKFGQISMSVANSNIRVRISADLILVSDQPL